MSRARLLIFSKAPVPGQVKTRLIPALTATQAASLHADLAESTVAKLAASSDWETQLWCSPHTEDPFFQALSRQFPITLHQQIGSSLGERMSYALLQALDSAEHAVVVGTDCPMLDQLIITQMIHQLQGGNDAVIVPADDGGYVALALARHEAALFDNIQWGTNKVFQQTLQRMRSLNWRWQEMPSLWDVDRPEDYARLRNAKLIGESVYYQ